jgi:hypothetical protein
VFAVLEAVFAVLEAMWWPIAPLPDSQPDGPERDDDGRLALG